MKHIRKFVSIGLIGAICLLLLAGLSGCGKKAEPSADEVSGDSAQDALSYMTEFLTVGAGAENGVNEMLYSNGRFLARSYGKIGEKEIPEGVTPEWEGQYWIWGTRLFWINMDGSTEEIPNYKPMELPADIDPDAGSVTTQSIFVTGQGDIYTLEYISTSTYSGPSDLEMYSDAWYQAGYYDYLKYEQHFFLRALNADGSERERIALTTLEEQFSENNMHISAAILGADGNLYLLNDCTVFILDLKGNLVAQVKSDNMLDSLSQLADGTVAAFAWIDGEQKMFKVDPTAKTLTDCGATTVEYYATAKNFGEDKNALYYTKGSNFIRHDMSSGEETKVLNWISCDIADVGSNSFILPDGRLAVLQQEYKNDHTETQLALVSAVPASSLPQKVKLTFATQNLDYNDRKAIICFNRMNESCHIDVKDYSEYNTKDDYSAGLTKLKAEVMAGNVPDILDLEGMNYEQLASKSLLLDLYPYLDKDTRLSRSSLLPGAAKAMETNGHLYRVVPGFYLEVVAGAPSIVGEKNGWTLSDLKNALSKMPEGCTPFNQAMTRGAIFNTMLQMEMKSLIDWETGKCNFDSELFRNILEFSAMFPAEYVYDEDYVWTEADDEYNRIATGKQMLMTTTLSDFDGFQVAKALFGGDVNFVGYPVSEGVGNAIMLQDGYSVSAKCSDPDAAWDFIRTLLSKEYQIETVRNYPTNAEAFHERMKQAMVQEYEKDANGNYVLDDQGKRIPISHGSWDWGGKTVELYALTQDEADFLTNTINSVTRVIGSSTDTEIVEMIAQECEGYFAGQKSADDVVRQLQSKMNIRINEMR